MATYSSNVTQRIEERLVESQNLTNVATAMVVTGDDQHAIVQCSVVVRTANPNAFVNYDLNGAVLGSVSLAPGLVRAPHLGLLTTGTVSAPAIGDVFPLSSSPIYMGPNTTLNMNVTNTSAFRGNVVGVRFENSPL